MFAIIIFSILKNNKLFKTINNNNSQNLEQNLNQTIIFFPNQQKQQPFIKSFHNQQMSYKAVFEFILLLHDFKNIDLPNQGLVAVQTSIYQQQKNNKKNYAIPHAYPYQRNYKLTKKKIRQQALVNQYTFKSKTVIIRYTDQNVPLDDFIQFRLQLEAFPYLNTDDIYLEMNLMFSAKYYASSEQELHLPYVTRVRMRLKQIQNGIFCFAEADFKQDYFSRVGFTLYGQLMRYKFEKYLLKGKQPSQREIARSKIENFSKLVIWSKDNYLQPGEDPFDFFYSNYVKKLRHSYYLIQLKVNNYLLVMRQVQMKVSKKFLNQKSQKQKQQKITQKQFRQYLQSYHPPLTLDSIDPQVQQVHIDNFQYFSQLSQDFLHQQFDHQKMKQQYQEYVKQKYGQRVFRTICYDGDNNVENVMKQNKNIAKKMRQKNLSLTEYPCENQMLLDNQGHEFVFYQVTMPKWMKEGYWEAENEKITKKTQNKEQKVVKSAKRIHQQPSLSQTNEQSTAFTQQQNDSQHQQQQSSSSNATQKSDSLQQPQEFFTQSTVHFPLLQYTQKSMLIVMCHGFQGSSYDMGIIQKGIRSQLPNASYLVARSNQNDTECDIEKMGEKLADEIKRYVRGYMDEETVMINFIGHSMGGIIARASLKHLAKYKQQLGFYCSLSSPHLGYLNGVDNKIKAGLWVLRKWKPIKSLDQLSMQQAKNTRKTFLYKLSKTGTLKYFRKLIFFSSFQDSYVSWHSARVSPHMSKNEQSRIETEMVQNILGLDNGKNNDTIVHRLDINFNVKGNSVDSLIGRAAHINLIIQDSLFDLINVTLPMLFLLKQHWTGVKGESEEKGKGNEIGKKNSGSEKNGKKESWGKNGNVKKEGSIFMLRTE